MGVEIPKEGVAYTVYPALHEEANEGWIWFWNPKVRSRSVVKVTNVDPEFRKSWSVCCIARVLDPYFVERYNRAYRDLFRLDENALEDVMIMSQWYREALGGFMPTRNSPTEKKIRLRISPARPFPPFWRDLQAASSHPDAALRLSTRLGILGAWLGLVALLPVLLAIMDLDVNRRGGPGPWILLAIAVVAAALAAYGCRGVYGRQQSDLLTSGSRHGSGGSADSQGTASG
jgi:hypothetical protein